MITSSAVTQHVLAAVNPVGGSVAAGEGCHLQALPRVEALIGTLLRPITSTRRLAGTWGELEEREKRGDPRKIIGRKICA